MSTEMHDDQLVTDAGVVRRLLGTQFPDWAELPVEPVVSTGTANAMYRLGGDMVVRLPLRPGRDAAVAREYRWLPALAPLLPVAVPVPLAVGRPSDEYPSAWSVCRWIDGEDATSATFASAGAVRDVAAFVRALRSLDPTDGPPPRAAPEGRGIPLPERDTYTRRAIAAAAHLVDSDVMSRCWERALSVAAWNRPPVWIHGDLAAGNLLVLDGRLSGVIDFSSLAVGDPACDLIVAWELFDRAERRTFRSLVGVDEATWERGRGWALSTAIVALPYYEYTNRFMVTQARRKLAAVLAD